MGVGELGYQKDRFKLSAYGEINSGDGDSNDDVSNNFEGFIGRYHLDFVDGQTKSVLPVRDYGLKYKFPFETI